MPATQLTADLMPFLTGPLSVFSGALQTCTLPLTGQGAFPPPTDGQWSEVRGFHARNDLLDLQQSMLDATLRGRSLWLQRAGVIGQHFILWEGPEKAPPAETALAVPCPIISASHFTKTSPWELEKGMILHYDGTWQIRVGGAQQPRYHATGESLEDAIGSLIKAVTEDAISDEARAWAAGSL